VGFLAVGFLEVVFLEVVFLEVVFLEVVFLEVVFLEVVFLEVVFLGSSGTNRVQLWEAWLPGRWGGRPASRAQPDPRSTGRKPSWPTAFHVG
jgi:hypothetical protein